MAELLERDGLLARLAAARHEGGRLVFVGGEAGAGKTSLVRAFAAEEEHVLQGACENLTTPTPLGPLLDVGDVAAAGEPRLVARALLDELRPGGLLVLEDLHWADQATLDVLRVLGRRIDTTRALVLATYREDEVTAEHPLRVVLGELASASSVERLGVPPLSLEAVRSLAEPAGVDGNALHRLTRGNAFYVTEVLATGGTELPATVRDAALARAAVLGAPARRLLDVAALVPARAELWLLESVTAAELEHLDECLSSGMLRAEGDAVAFRHELGRLALESAVPPQRRRALHSALMRALASPPSGQPDAARVAHHADEAGDTAWVLEYAPAAARRAAETGSHREAAAQYARALRHGVALPPTERAALLSAYSHETHLTGRYAEAVEAREEALQLFRATGDRQAEGDALWRLVLPLISLYENARAEAASSEAIAVLEKLEPSVALANAYTTQAYVRMLNRDNADGVVWGRKSVALAEQLGDHETLSFALNILGASHVMAGEIEPGIDYLLQSRDVAKQHGIEFREASAYTMLGSALGEMYELERSEEYLRTHIRFAEEHELEPAYSESWLACVLVYRGLWTEGATAALELLARGPAAISRITALIALGRVRARRGDPGASDVLDEALELSRPGGHLQRLGHVQSARAEAAWLAGDRERTVEEAVAVYAIALEKRHLWFAGELAYWQWKCGAPVDTPTWIAEPYRLQLEGDPVAAAAAWRAQGCPYEAARALAESDDEESLLEALGEFDRLGAAPAAKLVRERLRSLGAAVPRGPRPATRANPAALTRRELEVLRLVAGGLRNADVAERLVLSPRTVDHHVSAILRKLEVTTRGEAAAEATRLGLLEDR